VKISAVGIIYFMCSSFRDGWKDCFAGCTYDFTVRVQQGMRRCPLRS